MVTNWSCRWLRPLSHTGLLVILTGFRVADGAWPGVAICLVLPAIALPRRILVEEAALARVIGDPRRDYQNRTKRLVPDQW